MLKLIMTHTKVGTRDGLVAETFTAGTEYKFNPAAKAEVDLYNVFLKQGWARPVFNVVPAEIQQVADAVKEAAAVKEADAVDAVTPPEATIAKPAAAKPAKAKK